ncbi:MAG: hypothetical protein K5644_01845, partial [Lachnospiraceae bacterium]|nr:hypothetical protein [Lachnospiraceae bacterium]
QAEWHTLTYFENPPRISEKTSRISKNTLTFSESILKSHNTGFTDGLPLLILYKTPRCLSQQF